MEEADRVRWYTFALGSEEGFHTAHWHGQTLVSYGQRVDTIAVFPATTHIADMVPDNEGIWMYHCHVNHHIHGGMTSLFEVGKSTKPVPHTDHDEPVAPWIWVVIVLILLVPMLVFGGMFAKTYLPTPPVAYTAAPQSTPQRSRSGTPTGSLRGGKPNGHSGMNGNSATTSVNDERKQISPPVVIARAKITGYSPINDQKITEKRGVGLGGAIPSTPNASLTASTGAIGGGVVASGVDTSTSNNVITIHSEPVPVVAALPTTTTIAASPHQLVVALDAFGQQSH